MATVWQCNRNPNLGAAENGGGFDSTVAGGVGVDYSQGASPWGNFNNVVVENPAANPASFYFPNAALPANLQGNWLLFWPAGSAQPGDKPARGRIEQVLDTQRLRVTYASWPRNGYYGAFTVRIGGPVSNPVYLIGTAPYPPEDSWNPPFFGYQPGETVWVAGGTYEALGGPAFQLGAKVIGHPEFGQRGAPTLGAARPLLRLRGAPGTNPIYDPRRFRFGDNSEYRNIRFESDPAYPVERWVLGSYSLFVNCSFTPANLYIPPTTVVIDTENPSGVGSLSTGKIFLSAAGSFQAKDVHGRGDASIASGGPTLPALRLAGTGRMLSTSVTGTGALALGPFQFAGGTGRFLAGVVTGVGSLSLAPFRLDGLGYVQGPVASGTGDLALRAIFLDGSGKYKAATYLATGVGAIGPIVAAATGTFIPQAISAVVVTAPSRTAINVMTYRDAIEHLVDFADGLPQEADQRRARGAIQTAYREVAYARKWRYLQTHGRVFLSAPYQTTALTYDATTGVATLASGSWPSWAEDGTLMISGHRALYSVAKRQSATQLLLDSTFRPTESITTAVGATLFRSVYALPEDMWCMEEILDEHHVWGARYIPPAEWVALERQFHASGRPFRWSVIGHPKKIGQMAIALYGYPLRAETLDFLYTRRPRFLRLDGYELYSSAASGTRVQGVDTSGYTVLFSPAIYNPDGSLIIGFVYEAAMAGAILRLSRPGTDDRQPRGFGHKDQWWQQKTIVGQGATEREVVVDSPVVGGFGRHYTISDPVDLAEYLYDAFLRCCEYHFLLKTDPARARFHYEVYRQALLDAMGRDSMVSVPFAVSDTRAWRDPAWQLLTGQVTPSAG